MLPQFYITMATESEDSMKQLKFNFRKPRKKKDNSTPKDVFTFCRQCNDYIKTKEREKDAGDCIGGEQKEYMIDLITQDHVLIGHFISAMLISLILVIEK